MSMAAAGGCPRPGWATLRSTARPWLGAIDYANNKDAKRDLAKETLVGVLKGDILVHNHC